MVVLSSSARGYLVMTAAEYHRGGDQRQLYCSKTVGCSTTALRNPCDDLQLLLFEKRPPTLCALMMSCDVAARLRHRHAERRTRRRVVNM